jgi:hypothetical protein
MASDPSAATPSQAAREEARTLTPTLALAPESAAGEWPAPVTVPGYEIMDELGRGGMAVVYRAVQLSLQRPVALKMILSGAQASAAEVARFRIEAEAVARVRHPHIVQIFEVGAYERWPYLALELLEGGSLAALLKTTTFAPRAAAALVEKLARAVDAAHQQDIVHRDLKPGNVLLTKEGEPKIGDFGLAKRLDSDAALTRSGALIGTPSYMAPEQAEGRGRVGPPADIYALGAILYELLTGRPPFLGENSVDVIHRVLSDEPIAPRKLVAGVPRDLETICLKCLEKDPRRRYATADALADDLRSFLAREPIAARPPGIFGRVERWARLRPALAAPLVALPCFYLVHLALLAQGAEGEGGLFHWLLTLLVAVWLAGAGVFHWLTTRTKWRARAIYGWAAFDVAMLTAVLELGDGPRSPMTLGYLLLIAAMTLRFRPWLVWFVTALCVLSYAALVVDAQWRRPELAGEFKHWMFSILAMLVLGFIQHLLLRRIKRTQER